MILRFRPIFLGAAASLLLLGGAVLAQERATPAAAPAPGETKAAASASPEKKSAAPATAEIPLPTVEPAVDSTKSNGSLEPELEQQFDAFFKQLRSNKVDDAYRKLLEKSRIGKEQAIHTELVTQTTEMFKLHGKIESIELTRVRHAGKNVREIVYQMSCANHPSRWRIFAYHGGGRWQILDVSITSDLDKMFN